ncbi:carboxypeptidase-like regulatory domain-containing protein [Lutimonas saemankumensis]|uniref:carboxypeptidase-like regulatory domain-containing protein n=1 Tax=Lutimonas saemankumensis TaxID=483016 RepID=UPI001CD5BC46|nr:carboxypeptidase-like regulatory domain-containing protein [Lutimonas saemankumensis]MCA0931433.1 carboxypeptidase-like regulatory domain-containing protein [Lutimonas saemankumensis]
MLSKVVSSQEYTMAGKILDIETGKPVVFANIGFFKKNIGTVSEFSGAFKLNIGEDFLRDSLTISHISYESVSIPFKEGKGQTIFLKPLKNELEEVLLKSRKIRTKKLGVKTYNRLLWLDGVSKEDDILENAQWINIPDGRVRIKAVNVFLRNGFEADSAYIRLNFYNRNELGEPDEKIVYKHVLKKKKIEQGWLKLDLTKDDLYLEEDFFIGVEFIPNFKSPQEVFIGAILTKGKGYHKTSSQGTWKKIEGASAINVDIEY